MDPQLLRHYTEELHHLRAVGAEFAREFPKIASRLGMEGAEVADPFVERLLEGFAFLAARVQGKLDAEHPRLIAHLLEALCPGFLAPVPSMLVARLAVDPADPNLVKGHVLPRGSALLALAARGQGTHCEFRTAHAVTLWPIELVQVQYFSHAADLPLLRLPGAQAYRGGLRLRLRTGGGIAWSQLAPDRLALYISAPADVAFRLHELVLGAGLGSLVVGAPDGWRGPDSVQPLGHADDQALLPETHRNFSGCRLLQELAALPQRFLFFEITGLAARLAGVSGDEVELVLPFERGDPGLEALVDRDSLALHCTPAINLFPKRLDRIQLGPGSWQYHVVPDRTRPMDYEVHSLQAVVGHGAGTLGRQEFLPLYATYHQAPAGQSGYYTVQRQPRLLSARQQEHGPRASYVGDEVYLTLVDPRHAPYREDIRQLSVAAWVTNRDLPLLLPPARADGPPAWRLDTPGPVQRVDALAGPTRPIGRQPVGELGWSLVGLLTLARLPWADEPPAQAAATLQRLLRLYGPPDGAAWQRQLEGVRALSVRPSVARLPGGGRIAFGSGCDIELELDELAFQGHSAFLLASVLEHYFVRHANVNGYTRMSLRTPQRGLVRRWPARVAGAHARPLP